MKRPTRAQVAAAIATLLALRPGLRTVNVTVLPALPDDWHSGCTSESGDSVFSIASSADEAARMMLEMTSRAHARRGHLRLVRSR